MRRVPLRLVSLANHGTISSALSVRLVHRAANQLSVIAGLDPAIHPLTKMQLELFRRGWTRGPSPRGAPKCASRAGGPKMKNVKLKDLHADACWGSLAVPKIHTEAGSHGSLA